MRKIAIDGTCEDNFIIDAGDAAEGYYSTSFVEPPESPLKAAFDQTYLDTFNVEPGTLTSYTWSAYDAANVIIEAIKKVAIAEQDGRLYIPRAALVEAVRATSGYQGLTGSITCDKDGECATGQFDIFIVQGGKWVKVDH